MKILLIQSELEAVREPAVPIGLCYIASVLEGIGHDVRIYDPNTTPAPLMEVLPGELEKGPYDFIGISLRNIDNNLMHKPVYYYLSLPPLLQRIKELSPASRIMIGGTGFSIFAETIMKRHKEIDFGFYLEALDTIVELFEDLDNPGRVKGLFYREGDELKFTGARGHYDLSKLPEDPWRHIDADKYRNIRGGPGVVSKMGCMFKCAYCTYPQLSGGEFSYRSAEKIVDDVELLVTKYKYKSIQFIDAIFNYPEKHALDVCKEMIRRGIKVEWSAYFVEKYFSKELCEKAIESGCTLFFFSPDGIDDITMKSLGKVSREEDLLRTVKVIKEVPGAHAAFGFLLNAPGQTFSGFVKMIKFFIKTQILCPKKFVSVVFWHPRIYPHTSLHQYLVETEDYPVADEAMLPSDLEGLRKFFWVNPKNKYINSLFWKAMLKNKIKIFLSKAGRGGKRKPPPRMAAPSH